MLIQVFSFEPMENVRRAAIRRVSLIFAHSANSCHLLCVGLEKFRTSSILPMLHSF